jgi:hypothetical protein
MQRQARRIGRAPLYRYRDSLTLGVCASSEARAYERQCARAQRKERTMTDEYGAFATRKIAREFVRAYGPLAPNDRFVVRREPTP